MKHALLVHTDSKNVITGFHSKPYTESTDELTDQGFEVLESFDNADDARRAGNLILGMEADKLEKYKPVADPPADKVDTNAGKEPAKTGKDGKPDEPK